MNARRLAIGACVALALFVYLAGIGEAFLYGHQGWCAARRSVAGQNFVRHGFVETKFGPVENFGPAEPEEFTTYWHHPDGIHLLIGASFTAFGVGELQARAVPAALMLLCFLLFWRLSQRWWSGVGRWAARVAFLTTPMLGYYGPFVNQEVLVLTVALAAVWLWTRWREAPADSRWRWALWSAALAVVAAWSDWPWFVFAFGLATVELGRLLITPPGSRDVRWLLAFSPAVLVGLAGVVLHLVAIQGAADPIAGFKTIFGDRSGGAQSSLGGLVGAAGHWWVDLFTPTLVSAGALWLLLVCADVWRRRFATRHAVALVFLAVGLIWVVVFRQGARIHEYWPFYAAVYFVIAGADLAGRLWSWLIAVTPGPWGRRAAGVLVVALIALQGGAGLAGVMSHHRRPDRNNFESDDYRYRQVVLGRWIAEHTEPADRVAFHDAIIGNTKFQLGFYSARNRSSHKIDGRRRSFRPPRRALAVIDLRRAPQISLRPILEDWARHHPITVLEDFAIADLRRRVDAPEVTWLTRRERLPTPLFVWLESSVYRPGELARDPVLEAELLRALGQDELALQRYATAEAMPGDLRHRVADHNLARLAGLDPDPTAWLAADTGLPPDREGPIPFGDALELVGLRGVTPGRTRYVLEAVFRVLEPPGPGWRPFADRLSRHVAEPDDERKRPLGVRALPPSGRWRAGDLAYVRIFVSLHQDHDSFELLFGFWRPVRDKRGKKEHLVVGSERGLRVPLDGVEPLPAWPAWMSWLDPHGIAKESD